MVVRRIGKHTTAHQPCKYLIKREGYSISPKKDPKYLGFFGMGLDKYYSNISFNPKNGLR